MKNLILLVTISLLFGSPGLAQKAQEDKIPTIGASMWINTLLKATMDNDIELFESVCDDNMKEAITPDQLEAVSIQVSALMKEGYQKTFLGVLDRAGFKTYYWKIDFDKQGVSDMLAELSISDKKVSGFFIR